MFRLNVASIALVVAAACQPQQQAHSEKTSGGRVEIVGSREVEPADLYAMGGSFRDPADPFWQMSVSRDGIMLNGVASPTPHTMVTLPAVKSTVAGATETWVTDASGQKIRIEAVRERCVRPDGFVFRQRVTVEIGSRRFVTCGNRGSDPPSRKE